MVRPFRFVFDRVPARLKEPIKTLLVMIRQQSRRLSVRVIGFGVLACASLGLGQIVDPFLPSKVSAYVGGTALDRLLDLIASAMLVVTTFSLSVMVTVYRSTSTQFTPRIHRLIISERATQNTLATFIGAFVYALVAIVLRETGYILDDKALVSFIITIIVLIAVIVMLIRWTLRLQTFGSLTDAAQQLEEITRNALLERRDAPCLGAHVWADGIDVPDGAMPVRARRTGYISYIWQDSMNGEAKDRGIEIFLTQTPGCFVLEHDVLAYVVDRFDGTDTDVDRTHQSMIEAHIDITDARNFDQDPRFGLIVMGEIASKALSPGINDPGTAIEIITRLLRILGEYRDESRMDSPVRLDRLWLPPIVAKEVLIDAFEGINRDGAGQVEVQIRLQKALAALTRHPDRALAQAARDYAPEALTRALQHMDFEPDRDRLRAALPVAVPTLDAIQKSQ